MGSAIMMLQLSSPYTDPESPKTVPHNADMEVKHQKKQAAKADFRLKL